MFHLVKCDPLGRSALGFLFWKDGNLKKRIKIYQLTVHCFDLTCSPCVATYALKRTVIDNSKKFSKLALYNVKNNFYVDHWLTSERCQSSNNTNLKN